MKLRTSITQAHDIPDEPTERQDLQCQISTHIGSQTRTDFETYTVTNRHKYLETLLHLNSFLCRPTTAPFYLFSLFLNSISTYLHVSQQYYVEIPSSSIRYLSSNSGTLAL